MDEPSTTLPVYLAVAAWYTVVAAVWYTQILRPLAHWSRWKAALWSAAWPALYTLIMWLQVGCWWRKARYWLRGRS